MDTQTNTQNYFEDGFRAGACDRMLGYHSVIASTCPEHNLPGYARGYEAGYRADPYSAQVCLILEAQHVS